MSHYHNPDRDYGVIIHHTGGPGNHTVETNAFCSRQGASYDFTVTRQGRIYVCRHHTHDYLLWQRNQGEHCGNTWCNQHFMGIGMHGCFGGDVCADTDPGGPSEAQECAVAFLMSHTNVPTGADRTRPHARHRDAGTDCPGTNFTAGRDWNANGRALRDRLRSRRANWDNFDCCFPGDWRCPA